MLFDKLKCPSTIPYMGKRYAKGEKIDPNLVMTFIMGRLDEWKRKGFYIPSDQDNPCATQDQKSSIPAICLRLDFAMMADTSKRKIKIPLMKHSRLGECRQYVFGRISNLMPYYQKKSHFVTLLLLDDVYYGQGHLQKTMDVNDLYVYCAMEAEPSCGLLLSSQDQKTRVESLHHYFPIRIVLHPSDVILFKTNFISRLSTILGARRTARQYESILQWNQDWRASTILAREICQLMTLFDVFIYQSNSYRHIFFIKSTRVSVRGLTLIYPQ